MRLIDADAIEQDLFDADWMLDNDEHMVEDILRKQPTIDAVPVVRCKDCKRWGARYPSETDKIKCCQIAGYMIGENGYCLYAEAKADNGR